jgi:hypothetical protein
MEFTNIDRYERNNYFLKTKNPEEDGSRLYQLTSPYSDWNA